MSVSGKLWGAAAGAAGLAAATGAATTAVIRQRRRTRGERVDAEHADETGAAVRPRRLQAVDTTSLEEDPGFGTLRAPSLVVVTADGVDLHAEIEEVEGLDADEVPLTVVFAHGFTLNQDAFHFQREAFRGKVRMVFYDQRSHGRSERSPEDRCTIEQLGQDLKLVVETTAPGPAVVVGHSMGGMSVVSMAAQFPEMFGDKVVGSALIATTAGGLDPGRVLFPMLPLGALGGHAVDRVVRVLDRSHVAVDRLRAAGFRIARTITDSFSFGDDVPASWAQFVFDMIDATPFEVVADFFPAFATLDHFDHLEGLAQAPCTVVAGTADRLTGVGHSRKLHARICGSELYEAQGAGHMVLMERHQDVNAELEHLLQRAETFLLQRDDDAGRPAGHTG